MEIYFSVLALVISLVKVTLVWLNYRDCKKAKIVRKLKRTQIKKLISQDDRNFDLPIISVYPFHQCTQ